MELQVVSDRVFRLGEGPLWNHNEKTIYWTDITGRGVFKLSTETNAVESVFEGQMVGGFTFQQDGGLLLFMEKGKIAKLYQGELQIICESLPGEEHNRFNDVIADPEGRVFCGTMASTPENPGSLYRLNTDGSISKILENIQISNGLGFNNDLNLLYYIDTPTMRIDVFDYDRYSGEISNRRLFVDTSDQPGIPDGMTVDANGNIWNARWNGWCCIQYNQNGEKTAQIDFPARKISSVIFGGEDYKKMYFTTANRPQGVDEDEGPEGGKLFSLQTSVVGKPEFLSRVMI